MPSGLAAALLLGFSAHVLAGAPAATTNITLDNSLVAAKVLNPVGNVVAINGKTSGQINSGNLFFSFKDFSLGKGFTAQFQCSMSDCGSISNVISRVTGGNVSTIDGVVRFDEAFGSGIKAANFWFFNPYGVVLGENAQINVPAALHIGSADQLQFGRDYSFSAIDANGVPEASVLKVPAPESFGFIVAGPAQVGNSELRASVVGANNSGDDVVNNATLRGDVTARNDVKNNGTIEGNVSAGSDVNNYGSITGSVSTGNNINNEKDAIISNNQGGVFLSAGNNIINAGTINVAGSDGVEIIAGNKFSINNGELYSVDEQSLTITAPTIQMEGNGQGYMISRDGSSPALGSIYFYSGTKYDQGVGTRGVHGEFSMKNASIYYGSVIVDDNGGAKYLMSLSGAPSGIKAREHISVYVDNRDQLLRDVDVREGASQVSRTFLDSPDTKVNGERIITDPAVLPRNMPLPYTWFNGNVQPTEHPCAKRQEKSSFDKGMNRRGNYTPEISAQVSNPVLSLSVLGGEPETMTDTEGEGAVGDSMESRDTAGMADMVSAGC